MSRVQIKELYVNKNVAEKLERWCRQPPDENVAKDEPCFDKEVAFDDGRRVAIQVVASLTLGEPCWTQGVLFDGNGTELACTDVGESFLGEYALEAGGSKYVVNVIADSIREP